MSGFGGGRSGGMAGRREKVPMPLLTGLYCLGTGRTETQRHCTAAALTIDEGGLVTE